MEDAKKIPNNITNLDHNKLIPLVLVSVVALFFYPTVALLYSRWIQWDEGLSHGLIIIGLFLFFTVKSSPWSVIKQPAWIDTCCYLCLIALSIFWFLAHITNIYILEQLALIPALFLLTAIVYGWQSSYQQKMLLAMPIFAIPIWDIFNSPLVNLSSLVVGQLVQWVNMPAVIDGNSIFIPFGHILIADGCSGIRYFVIALALGYLISYLNNYHFKNLLITLAIAATLGLAANWIRIFFLVVIGYETEMQSSMMSDHEYFGWFIFALIGFPAIYFAPVVRSNPVFSTPYSQHRAIKFIPALIALGIGPLLNLTLNPAPHIKNLTDILEHRLTPISHYRMPMIITSPEPDHRENAAEGAIYFQIDQYQRHNSQEKLVPYINRLYSNEQWSIVRREEISISGMMIQKTQFRHKNNGNNVLQLQWFSLANTTTSSLIVAKLLQIPAQLRGQNSFTIISLQADCEADDCERAQNQLINRAQSLATKIREERN